MSEVKIPEGYKQTEVGVIPEDWKVKDIGETLTIKHGKDQKQVESAHGQYPIFGTGGQMGWANDFLYNKPSVLIGRKGSINKPRYINVPFWTVDTLFYSQVHNGYDEKFMFYKFCLIDWMNYNEASGVPSLNASTISNVKISVPKKPEQTAIATALSDVDNLIQSLDKLIAKKEAVKTGTMQQLLTGKTRLPEFATREDGSKKELKQTELGKIPEDWEVVELGTLVNIKSGESPSKFSFYNDGIPYYKVEQLNNGKVYACETPYYINNIDTIAAGSIVFPKRGASIFSNKIRILKYDSFIDTNLMTLTCNNYLDSYFLFLLLSFIGLDNLADTTSVPQINNKHIIPLKVPVPSKKEQTAIATILSDMDAEIQALQQRLEKTKDIKQGMMQQLLTGKVRLVDSAELPHSETSTIGTPL